jgi:hypothetical protein
MKQPMSKMKSGGQHNLRSAAYEALMELVKNSPKVSDVFCVATEPT